MVSGAFGTVGAILALAIVAAAFVAAYELVLRAFNAVEDDPHNIAHGDVINMPVGSFSEHGEGNNP